MIDDMIPARDRGLVAQLRAIESDSPASAIGEAIWLLSARAADYDRLRAKYDVFVPLLARAADLLRAYQTGDAGAHALVSDIEAAGLNDLGPVGGGACPDV